MTFSSDEIRIKYHSLPTATQVHYAELESRLAKRGALLHIDDVIPHGPVSEIVIRISEDFKLPSYDLDPFG